jgi:hypothetical protein
VGELTLDGVEVDDAGLVLGELEHVVGTLGVEDLRPGRGLDQGITLD